MEKKPIALLNVTIATSLPNLNDDDTIYIFRAITYRDAVSMVFDSGHVSYIGHESTANILSEVLGTKIEVNREAYEQQVGEPAICFKLRGRGPEGQILSREQIEKIGYDFFLVKRLQ